MYHSGTFASDIPCSGEKNSEEDFDLTLPRPIRPLILTFAESLSQDNCKMDLAQQLHPV